MFIALHVFVLYVRSCAAEQGDRVKEMEERWGNGMDGVETTEN